MINQSKKVKRTKNDIEDDCCNFMVATPRYRPSRKYMISLYSRLIDVSDKNVKHDIEILRENTQAGNE